MRECPNCGSIEVHPFAPTPYGYWCDTCKETWDEVPETELGLIYR